MAKVKASPNASLPVAAVLVEPDIVDRIFDYLLQACPDMGERFGDLKALQDDVRTEFAGRETYIRSRSAIERQARVQKVLALFNGRNASEVARELHMSRPHVYRILKQAGYGRS